MQSALARPKNAALYGGEGLAYQAAVLAHGIAETQPFLEGNKRIAVITMTAFLRANGYRLAASDEELAGWLLRLSEHEPVPRLVGELAERIQEAMHPIERG